MKNELLESVKGSVKYWWFSLIIGVLAVIVGFWALAAPLETIGILTIFFIASLFVGGFFDIVFSVSNHKTMNGWGWTLVIGILSVVFAIILLCQPITSMLVLVTLAGFWVLFAAISGISGAIEMQRAGFKDWGWLLVFGILALIFSIVLIVNPVFAGSFVVGLFSFSMVFYGLIRVFYAFKMRKVNKMIDEENK